jgi:hypothetical protein
MRQVKATLKYAVLVGGILIVLLIGLVIWKANFFLLPLAAVEVNGRNEGGYVYANSYLSDRVTHLVITRSEAGGTHSYLVWLEDDPHHGAPVVSDCESWTAPRMPLFMFPHVNPPCVRWYAAEDAPPQLKTPNRNVKVEGHSLEFTANDGKRVTVRW